MSGVIILFCGHVAWTYGLLTPIGLSGVAFADDVDRQIDTKIQTALAPVNSKLDVQGGYIKRLVKKDIREDLYDKYREFCSEENPRQRQAIRDDIEDLQGEHSAVTNTRYPEPACEDL